MAEHSPEPWQATGMLYDETLMYPKRGKRKEYPGIFDANGILIGDSIIGTDYNENASTMHEADIRRIVACVNACAGIPTEELEREEPYVTTVALTTLRLLREFYERGGLKSVPAGCTVTPQINISPAHHEQFFGELLNPESWRHSDTAIRVCRNAGYKVTYPDGSEIQ